MKYLIIVIAVLLVASTTVLGYFVIQQDKQLKNISGPAQPSNEVAVLKGQIAKIQNELDELKTTLSHQTLLIQTMKEVPADSSDKQNQQAYAGLFKDPDYTKEFDDRVDKAIKGAQHKQAVAIQKQVGEVTQRFREMGQQMLDDFVDQFSTNSNLDAYQKQEFAKILQDRASQTMALWFMQFGPQKLPPEEFKSRQEAIRTESNGKVKQILLPEQYEQYQKVESQFANPMQGMFGRQQPQQPQQQPPQQDQTPQVPK